MVPASTSTNTHSFFPKLVATGVSHITTGTLLILTCVYLIALRDERRQARHARDTAQNDYDSTLNAINLVNSQIEESTQRVSDLDCALAGFPAYNADLIQFQHQLMQSSLPNIDKLHTFWNASMVSDFSRTDQNSARKSYQVLIDASCPDISCDTQGNCQTTYYDCSYYETRYYNELTTVVNNYANILQGSGTLLPSLGCGFYSINFQAPSPESYITFESPHQITGSMKNGAVYVAFTRNWGSRISMYRLLDEIQPNIPLIVPNTGSQDEAITSITIQLGQVLNASLILFNNSYTNYPALQTNISNNIPKLEDEVLALTNTSALQYADFLVKQEQYEEADEKYSEGLALWLPLLFTVSFTVMLITNRIAASCRLSPEQVGPQPAERELAQIGAAL